MKTKISTVDEYIASFPADVQKILRQIRATVKNAVPQAEETIKYDIPAYVLQHNLIFFGAYKKHIGFFGVPTGKKAFEKAFEPYKTGRGSIQFPLDRPMPLKLIERIVKFRVKEHDKKAAANKD